MYNKIIFGGVQMNMEYHDRYFCGFTTIDSSLRIKKADDEFYRFAGDDALYSIARIIHPDDLYKLEAAIMELSEEMKHNIIALRMGRADGEYRWILCFMDMEEDNNGERLISIKLQDITSFKSEIDILKNSNDEYSEYFSLMEYLMLSYDVSSGSLKIFLMGNNNKIDFFNGTLEEWRDAKIADKDIEKRYIGEFEKLIDNIKKGSPRFESELKMKIMGSEDKSTWCMIKGKTIVGNHGKKHVIATISVINTATKKNKINVGLQSVKDSGTDLLNKRTITEYAIKAIKNDNIDRVTFGIIDLDDFKYINDTYGHMFGDQVLYKMGRILVEAVGNKGTVGRIGGDEMFIVLENMADEQEIRSVLRTIRTNIEWAYKNSKENVNLSCSIGCATYPEDADNYEDLFNIADKMLYLAKEKGKNRYIIYESTIHEQYLKGEVDTVITAKDMYKYNKLAIVNEVIAQMYEKGSKNIDEVCEKVGLGFELEDISIYFGSERKRTAYWGIFKEEEYDGSFFDKDNYIANFDVNNIFVIDNVKSLEDTNKAAYDELIKNKVRESVQYMVGTKSNPIGFIAFNRSKLSKKWPELDISYLAIIAKTMSLIMF